MQYAGGKNQAGLYQWIINRMPPHSVYVEAFLGSGAVLRMKRRALVATIAIDVDDTGWLAFSSEDAGGVRFVHDDAIAFLGGEGLPRETLVYCDPPYLMETRRGARAIYANEMTALQHRQLLRCCLGLDCMVMISGYWSELYDKALQGWRCDRRRVMTRGGTWAEECLWMNYPAPFALHDYRYLGCDFRERERIKRRKARWVARLEKMPELERFAVLDAIEVVRYRLAVSGGDGPSRQ